MVPAHNRFAVVNAMVLVAALVAMGPVAVTGIGHRTAAATAVAAAATAVAPAAAPTAASCTVPDFDRAAGKAAAAGFTRTECAQGWEMCIRDSG